jgi:hypothetical protein
MNYYDTPYFNLHIDTLKIAAKIFINAIFWQIQAEPEILTRERLVVLASPPLAGNHMQRYFT